MKIYLMENRLQVDPDVQAAFGVIIIVIDSSSVDDGTRKAVITKPWILFTI